SLWFVSLVAGKASYHYVQDLLLSPLGLLVLLGWSFSFFYHLCNGIRHLLWDIGIGYEKAMVRRTGWAVIFSSVILTSITWAIGLMKWEGLL
ncbi:MAG: succinate dehydrogenase, cytochrome b556 subunit, partial [Caedimonadaceae bacterium]